ncbi:MAG: TIGR01458 family HAD-type hydrolase [Alphaproteobacteria bacterium]|nr:TIGR01458 family HAD-type hydrolase [Alphaproteobacteria bacterium]
MNMRGLLLDLEGVLYQGDVPIPGVAEAISALAASGIKIRYLTNTTTRPRQAIVDRLTGMGFELTAEHVFTPGIAAGSLLRQRKLGRIHLAAPPELAKDFADVDLVDDSPDAIVLGDLHRGFDWDRLNALFQMVQGGAVVVALHKNRYCRRDGQIALDLGPFVAALEYAADTRVEVVGKPSPLFFSLALADLGLDVNSAAMVGDDIEADIGGAKQVGMTTIQVKTGKFTSRDMEHPSIRPDHLIDTAADLPGLLLDPKGQKGRNR